MEILEQMGADGHEQLVVVSDASSGLKAIIAIHDTTLGPACGGTRIWPYKSEQEAIRDALRLSRAMTYKAAAADLPLGGGKGVIIADSHTEKTEALVRAYKVFFRMTDIHEDGLRLENLTPGDFAQARKQAEVLGISKDTTKVIALLIDISRGKPGAFGAVGFMK